MDPDYIADIEHGTELVEDLLSGWTQNLTCRADVVNFRMVMDDPEQILTELTHQGEPAWTDADPVHCIPAVYDALVKLLASMLLDVDSAEPQAKRQRLESVVVQREGAVVNTAPSRSTASWSTGMLPPTRGRGGRGRGNLNRGQPFRGRQRGWFKPPRGGRGRF
jgi:hypothetical protein